MGMWRLKVVSLTYLSDGWWEFWLECGHGGKLLLGMDFRDKISTLRCHLCTKQEKTA